MKAFEIIGAGFLALALLAIGYAVVAAKPIMPGGDTLGANGRAVLLGEYEFIF